MRSVFLWDHVLYVVTCPVKFYSIAHLFPSQQVYYSPAILEAGHKLSSSGVYFMPDVSNVDTIRAYLGASSASANPCVFLFEYLLFCL